MTAVKERLAELETLRSRFATRLVGHLEALMENEVRPKTMSDLRSHHNFSHRIDHVRPGGCALHTARRTPASATRAGSRAVASFVSTATRSSRPSCFGSSACWHGWRPLTLPASTACKRWARDSDRAWSCGPG